MHSFVKDATTHILELILCSWTLPVTKYILFSYSWASVIGFCSLRHIQQGKYEKPSFPPCFLKWLLLQMEKAISALSWQFPRSNLRELASGSSKARSRWLWKNKWPQEWAAKEERSKEESREAVVREEEWPESPQTLASRRQFMAAQHGLFSRF